METLYFSLGIASVVVTAIVVAAVWSIVKVSKLTTQMRNDKQYTDDGIRSVHHDITMVQRTIENGIEARSRDTESTFDALQRDINDRFDNMHRELDNLNKESLNRDEQLNRYIDSRIDKLSMNKKKETPTA